MSRGIYSSLSGERCPNKIYIYKVFFLSKEQKNKLDATLPINIIKPVLNWMCIKGKFPWLYKISEFSSAQGPSQNREQGNKLSYAIRLFVGIFLNSNLTLEG